MNRAGDNNDSDSDSVLSAGSEWTAVSAPPWSTSRAPIPLQWWRLLRGYFNLQRSQAIALRWGRLLRSYFGIRRQQLIFNTTGTALQGVEAAARERVSRIYPIEKPTSSSGTGRPSRR